MKNKEFAQQLSKRTTDFGINVIRLSSTLPTSPEALVVRTQITKSGTSVGANYREANRARSKADFRNKTKICESECSETQYWLELILGVKWKSESELGGLLDECNELLAIFTSINSTASKS